MIANAIFISLACYIVLLKLDIKKVVNWEVAIDVGFTIFLAILFAGTFSGLMVAGIAGLILSGLLWFSKQFFGIKYWRGMKHGFDKEATNVSGW